MNPQVLYENIPMKSDSNMIESDYIRLDHEKPPSIVDHIPYLPDSEDMSNMGSFVGSLIGYFIGYRI